PLIQVEQALLKVVATRTDASLTALLARVEQLERGAGEAGGEPPSRPAGDSAPKAKKASGKAAAGEAKSARGVSAAAVAAGEAADPGEPADLAILWPAVLEQVRVLEGGAMMAALLADAHQALLEQRRRLGSVPQ